MNKSDRLELDSLFKSITPLFRSRCWICQEKYNTKEAFTIHHLSYIQDELNYADFKLPNGKPDRLSYYRYLIPIVKTNPKRFMLLHHKHHWLAESWARLKPANFKRMVKVARQINQRKFRLN